MSGVYCICMATPLPTGDPARAALEASDEVLARLDEMTTKDEPAPQPAEVIPLTPTTIDERLSAIDEELDVALEAGDEAAIRALAQKGIDSVRAERSYRQKALEDAENYFNEALTEYGESGEETVKAAKESADWKRALQGFDEYVTQMETHFDANELIANLHVTGTPESVAEVPVPMAEPVAEVKERAATLQELLAVLDEAEAAYAKKIEEIKAKKKDIAQQLIDERIAQLKAGVGA